MSQDNRPAAREWWVPVYCAKYTHEISNLGRIRSWVKGRHRLKTPRLMLQRKNKDGYPVISLNTDKGKTVTKTISRIMGLSFYKKQKGKTDIAHNNGIRDDNRLENLRWATKYENSMDTKLHGNQKCQRGENNSNAKLTANDVKKIRVDKRRTYIVAKQYGVGWQTIDDIRKGRKWKSV